MKSYVLDANLFFNMEAGFEMGKTTQSVVENVTRLANKFKKEKTAEFFMPPRVIDEFLSFFEDKNQPFIKNFLSATTIKSPDSSNLNFSAQVFYKLVEDIRERSYRGLRVGEEEIEKAARLMSGQTALSTKDFQIKIGSVVNKFRQRYRQATRFGFLDSLADLDLIVLSKELDGFLVTSDEGVRHWGRVFGIKEVRPEVWRSQLQEEG